MHRVLTVVLVLLMILVFATVAGAQPSNEAEVWVDNQQLKFPDQKPFIAAENNRVYVPVRAVAVAMDAQVSWQAEEQQVLIETNDRRIQLVIGEQVPLINGSPGVPLDAPAQLTGYRVLVPLRFVAENLGAQVSWDSANRIVEINIAGEVSSPAKPQQPIDLNTVPFSLKIFKELREPGENTFISPASVYLALALTYPGAEGDTLEAFSHVLQATDMDLATFNQECADLRKALADPDEKVDLTIADSLWLQKGLDFYQEYIQTSERYHGAKVEELDYNYPEAAADRINSWADENTGGMIREIIAAGDLDPLTALVLVNAIHFYGEWTHEFDPELTTPWDFQTADDHHKEVQMMLQEGEYLYLDTDGFQAVKLPYGANERLGMYVFLPDESLDSFYQHLNADNWEKWMQSFQVTEGKVGLPRFKMEYEQKLNTALESMGLGVAFDPHTADFGNMSPLGEEFYISQVKHKALIEVDEKGTEAAAVTAIIVGITSAPAEPERFELIADRPFFFVIQDEQTKTILFAGDLVNPQ